MTHEGQIIYKKIVDPLEHMHLFIAKTLFLIMQSEET